MSSERSTANLPCVLACLASIASPAWAQEVSVAADEISPRQAYYERIIRKIEPQLVGRPQRLPLYLELFQREMINDLRLFPFDVQAEWTDEGRVLLTGFVGFQENRDALLAFLRHLGFQRIDDRIDVLPSKSLGQQRFGFVTSSHLFCYSQPTGRQEVLTDCLLGAPVHLLKEAAADFVLGQGAEGYVGYVDGKRIRRVDANEFTRYQSGPQVRVRHDVRTAEGLLIPLGARLKYVGRHDQNVAVELPTGDKTIISSDACDVHDGRPNPRGARVIKNAASLLGTDYRWGGNTSDGIDCSGLMQVSFAAEGIHLPRDSNQQMYLGSLTATRWYKGGLRPGDTLFFLGQYGKISHTALYVGNDRYIEAVRPVVRYTSFNPEDEDYDQRRAAAFCFAKRLLE